MESPLYNEDQTHVRCGPFSWARNDQREAECWDLIPPGRLIGEMTSWCWSLKNYGGEPGPGFAGWKLVSGGPFDKAGAWKTRDEAFIGVVGFLVKYLQTEAVQRIRAARLIENHLRSFLSTLPEISAEALELKTVDWQVSHTENHGRTTVVFNLNDDPNDGNGLSIHLKGRNHGKFAERLTELLNLMQIESPQSEKDN